MTKTLTLEQIREVIFNKWLNCAYIYNPDYSDSVFYKFRGILRKPDDCKDCRECLMNEFRASLGGTGAMNTGLKFDTGKICIDLVLSGFANALLGVSKVGTFGAEKYSENSWQNLDNGIDRYKDALFRHLFAYLQGEEKDKESGLHHLDHAAWNILALRELEIRGNK